MSRIYVLWCALLLCLLSPMHAAQAQSCTTAATNVTFSSVSPISSASVAATGTLSVTCTWPSLTLTGNAQVCLNLNASSPRTLTNGSNALAYNLYTDAAHATPWGSATAGTTPISLTLTKPGSSNTATATATIYGQVSGNQTTVPTVGNSNTVYSQSFMGSVTSQNVGFYALIAPSCASLTNSSGTFPFSASATVVNNCTISATNLAFATTSTLSSLLSATGALSVQCTNGDAYQIALSSGSSGTLTNRTMKAASGDNVVNYQLYQDASHSVVWGNGTSGSTMKTGLGSGLTQSIPVYGAVPAQTTPPPGTYSDTITATISF